MKSGASTERSAFQQQRFAFEDTRPVRPRAGSGDRELLLIVFILALLGLVMIYSASGVLAAKVHQDGAYFLKRQLLWITLGLTLFWGASRINIERLRDWTFPITCLAFLLLAAALFFGAEINGARRWIRIGSVAFQPSEIAKLAAVIYLAGYIAKGEERLHDFFEGLAPALVVIGAEIALILVEPDLGTTVTLLLVTALMLFVGGVSLKHLFSLGLLMIPLVIYWILKAPYRRERLMTYLKPEGHASASGFQMIQSYLALGSGGVIGTGLGEGRQKLFFLPEPHTDFIFAVIGEELGLLGALSLLALFFVLLWKGVRIAGSIEEPFGRMLAVGTTLVVTLPALLNMGVATGLLPTKGLPLPFISYGGSSLIVNWLAMGLLFNLSRKTGARGWGLGVRK